MSGTTDLTALQGLLAAAVQAEAAETVAREADAEAELLQQAGEYTRSRLGDAAAEALGPWLAMDPATCPEDTVQAVVEITPRISLLFSLHADSGAWLSLFAYCGTCHHHRQPRIHNLADLAAALQRQGLR